MPSTVLTSRLSGLLGALLALPVLAQPIVPAPAFSAAELTALPTEQWITNGGNTYNQRYSPLSQINRFNVGELKALWVTPMGSGAQNKNAGQAQILHYAGTLYIPNGMNNVFALDVKTGRKLWEYHGNPDPKSGNPVGWTSRGVALGDGKVFMGQIDARLKALDQRSGEPVWDVAAEDWTKGFSITSAPLYYAIGDQGFVVTGFSGGELGMRGKVRAFDADTGALLWTFNTVPGPGETGHDSWPQDNNAWQHGGAPVWQTPAYDPELQLLYFSTGNPGPDLHGGTRRGDNLFTNSIVAIDAESGAYRWHFQQVHHDIWDYDSPNPVVLFDAQYAGVPRKGLVQVGKTGWAYILDRVTGEPLIGIEEKPVPQEPRQATAATQPYPIGDAIVPQEIDIAPERTTVVNQGRLFTPFWTEPVAMKPGTMGGANWPPSAYDPQSQQLYVCATDRISTFRVQNPLSEPGDNVVYMGGSFAQAPVDDRGIIAALDLTSNRLVWRREWRDICYNGIVNTAGGLLFVGRNDGRLTALDNRSGDQLWEFMTDAGVQSAVTTFEHEGEQYVVVHPGGAAFAGSKRGDSIWMFSLRGTLGPVAPAAGTAAPAPAANAALVADLARGAALYRDGCVACHGEQGAGGHGGGPALTATALSVSELMLVINAGRNNMPAFPQFSSQQLLDVSTYVKESFR